MNQAESSSTVNEENISWQTNLVLLFFQFSKFRFSEKHENQNWVIPSCLTRKCDFINRNMNFWHNLSNWLGKLKQCKPLHVYEQFSATIVLKCVLSLSKIVLITFWFSIDCPVDINEAIGSLVVILLWWFSKLSENILQMEKRQELGLEKL